LTFENRETTCNFFSITFGMSATRNGTVMQQRTRTFLNVSSFQILVMFRRGLFYSYLSIYLRYFLGLSVTETTLFNTLSMVVNVVFQTFVWGKLSDRLQLRRTLIIIGEIVAAIITFFIWYVHTLPKDHATAGWVIIIGMAVLEVFWSMSNLGWSALLSDLYPAGERAGLQGRLQSLGALGRVVGIWIGGLLYNGFTYAYPGWGFDKGVLFFIASGVMLISAVPMLFVPEGGVSASTETKKQSPTDRSVPSPVSDAVSRKFLVFLLAMVFVNFGMNSVVLLKPQYLTLRGGFDVSSETLSYILNVGSVGMFVIGLAIKRLSRRFSDENMLIVAALLAAVHLVTYPLASKLGLIYVSETIGGIARGVIMAAAYSYAAALIPPLKRGRQFAWYNGVMFLSWGLPATLITGPIVDYLISIGNTPEFSYKMAFVTATGMVAVGTLVLMYLRRMRSESPPQ
jgi:MFS family permease